MSIGVSNQDILSAWQSVGNWAETAVQSHNESTAVARSKSGTTGTDDVATRLLSRSFAPGTSSPNGGNPTGKAFKIAIRQNFLSMVKEMCGLSPEASVTELPKAVQHAMKLDGGLIERHDWDADKGRPLTARRINAVVKAVNNYREACLNLPESSFFRTEGGKRFYDEWGRGFDDSNNVNIEYRLRNVDPKIQNEIADALILLGPDGVQKHTLMALVARHEEVGRLVQEKRLSPATLYQVLVSPKNAKPEELVPVPKDLQPENLRKVSKDRWGSLINSAVCTFAFGSVRNSPFTQFMFNLGRFSADEITQAPKITKDSIYLTNGIYFTVDGKDNGLQGVMGGVARDFCPNTNEELTISFNGGGSTDGNAFVLKDEVNSGSTNQSARQTTFINKSEGLDAKLKAFASNEFLYRTMKETLMQQGTSTLRNLLLGYFDGKPPKLHVSKVDFNRNTDNSVTVSYSGSADAPKSENDGKVWSQSFTIFEDGRQRVDSLMFDGKSLIVE